MPNPITNFRDNFGTDLGNKLITKDYLMSVYPGIAEELGKTPKLWVWGASASGQLGNAQVTTKSTPLTTFAGGFTWKQVEVGRFHVAAIKTDGTLWTWGSGSNGRLGNAVITGNISTPVTTFAGATNWKQVSCGESHTAAIKTDGTLWTWGTTGNNGFLGNAVTTGNISTPVTTFAGGTNWKQVSCGSLNMAAIKTDGTLWIWGFSSNGALGNGITTGNRSTPVTTFAGGTNWKQVSFGTNHTAAIKTDGTLWIWGNSGNGKLGNAVITGNISTPVTTFAGGTNWKQVSCGPNHTAAIKTDGTLWTWGSGSYGQLGEFVGYFEKTVIGSVSLFSDTITTSNTNGVTSGMVVISGPDLVGASVLNVVANSSIQVDLISSSGYTNASFTFGSAPASSTSTPITTFAGGSNWKKVSCAEHYSAAIKTDGTLWTWGRGDRGVIGNNDTTTRNYTPVTTFAGGTNWKQIDVGDLAMSAIRSTDFI